LKKEKTYTDREDMTDLRRIERPNDKFLLFNYDSLALMRGPNQLPKNQGSSIKLNHLILLLAWMLY